MAKCMKNPPVFLISFNYSIILMEIAMLSISQQRKSCEITKSMIR